MKYIAQAIIAVGLSAIGAAGLYFGVEDAGWVLFFGLLAAWSL